MKVLLHFKVEYQIGYKQDLSTVTDIIDLSNDTKFTLDWKKEIENKMANSIKEENDLDQVFSVDLISFSKFDK